MAKVAIKPKDRFKKADGTGASDEPNKLTGMRSDRDVSGRRPRPTINERRNPYAQGAGGATAPQAKPSPEPHKMSKVIDKRDQALASHRIHTATKKKSR